jgi:quercetin dioxygenase-like cupin family protein
MEDNIKKLEFLTDQLLDHVPIKVEKPGFIEYDTIKGCSVAFALKNRPNCAVADCRMTKGTYFDWHAHNECEILVVFEGELMVYVQDKDELIVKDSEVVRFAPGIVHKVEAITDLVKLIAITVPASVVYPEIQINGKLQ